MYERIATPRTKWHGEHSPSRAELSTIFAHGVIMRFRSGTIRPGQQPQCYMPIRGGRDVHGQPRKARPTTMIGVDYREFPVHNW